MKQLEYLHQLLRDGNFDAMLITDPYNIRYYSGFSGGEGYLYVSAQKQYILTDFRYTVWAKKEAKGFEVIEISQDVLERINQYMNEDQVKSLAFEANHVLTSQYFEWKERLHAELIPVTDKLEAKRRIKSEEEISLLQTAESIGDQAFENILKVLKPGMTELEVVANLEFHMKSLGAEGLSFDTIAASGVNSAMPHATPSDKKLEKGDFLTMDFGCRYHGYCSDMTRTVVIGKATDKHKDIYEKVLEAQLAVLDKVHAGMTGKEVDGIARTLINSAGYENCFGHGLGHSVGLYIHERPALSQRDSSVIPENTVITVEPGIYIEGFGGVRIEDLIVVTKDGHINLTKSQKKMIEIN